MRSKPKLRKPAEIDKHAAKYRLLIQRSAIQGWGVFAGETIPAGREVIEYTGTLFSPQQMRARIEEALKRRGRLPRYVIRLNRYWRLDGEMGGSGAERINHSCDPNLSGRMREKHLLLYSKRRIRRGEELTLDYRFHPNSPRMICRCGSAKCRGTINLSAEQWKIAKQQSSQRRAGAFQRRRLK